eukprot:53340-Karenia_brevis.AAC.1
MQCAHAGHSLSAHWAHFGNTQAHLGTHWATLRHALGTLGTHWVGHTLGKPWAHIVQTFGAHR